MAKGRVRVYVRTRPVASHYDGFKYVNGLRLLLDLDCCLATAAQIKTPYTCWSRVQKDGETLSIDFQKDGESGLINNQLENVAFKVDTDIEGP
jgi:hypothetical protein